MPSVPHPCFRSPILKKLCHVTSVEGNAVVKGAPVRVFEFLINECEIEIDAIALHRRINAIEIADTVAHDHGLECTTGYRESLALDIVGRGSNAPITDDVSGRSRARR